MGLKNAVDEIYTQRENFIIIGLTGRSGSGCSTAAGILSKGIEEIEIIEPCLETYPTNQDRKRYIICKFAKKHWQPFFVIQARNIITSFILECNFEELNGYLKIVGVQGGIDGFREEYEKYYKHNKCLDKVIIRDYENIDEDVVYRYLTEGLPEFTAKFKGYIDNNSDNKFIPIYQQIGDNIRKNGIAIPTTEANVEYIYSIANRINAIIKLLRKRNKQLRESHASNNPKDYFVIDAFRNPFEAIYFKERYSAFYLISINTPNEDRLDRLKNKFDLSPSKIAEIDNKEYPRETPLRNFSSFISQNIASCIQHTDIHINNPGKYNNQNFNCLADQIVKYVSLIQHPGLVTPSRHEKLMQIAFTAKLNSGCLSRQVGAVVTNRLMAIKAIGWNSSPDEQVPCILRDVHSLLSNKDHKAYSNYERSDLDFRKGAQEYCNKLTDESITSGLNVSYCFKDIQNKKDGAKNQVHNRSLHAEENAFLQLAKYGGEGIIDGVLFTTASPCDSCSRKAYQLGISKIIYIDPYPGIAIDHVLMSGRREIDLVLFNGAIGRAYHQIYTPIIQIKDELEALMP